MVMVVNALHPLKALDPIVLTPFPKSSEAKVVQLEKASTPIEVTLFGIVTDVNDLQPANALSPIDVTLLPMVNDAIEEKPQAYGLIDITLLGTTRVDNDL